MSSKYTTPKSIPKYDRSPAHGVAPQQWLLYSTDLCLLEVAGEIRRVDEVVAVDDDMRTVHGARVTQSVLPRQWRLRNHVSTDRAVGRLIPSIALARTCVSGQYSHHWTVCVYNRVGQTAKKLAGVGRILYCGPIPIHNVTSLTSGQLILTKGRIARVDFSWGQCNVPSTSRQHCSLLQEWRCERCRHWFFAAHKATVTRSQCFSTSRTTPINSLGWSGPHLLHGSLGALESVPQTASWSVQMFCTVHLCAHATHTDRHADHATYDICCNRSYLYTACSRGGQ